MNLNIFSVIRDEEKEMIMNNNLSASKTTWLVVDKAQSGAVCLTVNRRLSLRQAVHFCRAGHWPDGRETG